MSDGTKIEYADASWPVVAGCDHVSPGCDVCYAARLTSGRLKHLPAYAGLAEGGRFNGQIRMLEDRLGQPLHWRKPRRIFVSDMADLFHDGVTADFIADVFAVMALTPWHTYLVFTKRHGRMRALLNSAGFWYQVGRKARHLGYAYDSGANHLSDGRNIYDTAVWKTLRYLPNVWLLVSVENQQWADIRIPALLETPAAVRGISAEPLLGPIDLRAKDSRTFEPQWLPPIAHGVNTPDAQAGDGSPIGDLYASMYGPNLDWVIAGGESGPGARPVHPAWLRSLRDQCQTSGVPYFLKQWGEWAPWGRLRDGAGLPVDNDRTLILNVDGQTRGRAAGSITNHVSEFSDGSHCEVMERVGKKAAGRTLDGRTWDEYPAVTR